MICIRAAAAGFLMAVLAVSIGIDGANAQNAHLEGILGEDNRTHADNGAPPWSAIGQVNTGGYRSLGICTGTRIGPSLVLTAAHCVFDAQRKKPLLADTIHFLAGVNRDKRIGHATAKCIVFAPGFDNAEGARTQPDLGIVSLPVQSLRHDLAVVVLTTDIPDAGAFALANGTVKIDGQVTAAGYHMDRRHVLSVHKSCHVREVNDGLIATDCDVAGGSSGGPLVVEEDGQEKIAGVMVAVGGAQTYAVAVSNWPNILTEAKCN